MFAHVEEGWMKVLSVHVGRPAPMRIGETSVLSGILKAPVAGSVRVRTLNLEGDGQADLSVHGGMDKAVYAYPSEHYGFWKEAYPWLEMPWGMLGENITTEGIDEHLVNIGDQFAFGSSILRVTQPRLPCQKL